MDTAFLYGSMKSGGGVVLASLFAVVGALVVGLLIGVAIGVTRTRSRDDDGERRGPDRLVDPHDAPPAVLGGGQRAR